jgi:hypothetical protein
MSKVITKCTIEFDIHKLGEIVKLKQEAIPIPTITQICKVDVWHLRLGHINKNN